MLKPYCVLSILIILSLASPVNAQSSPPKLTEPATSGTVSGTVQNKAGEPVAGASVVAMHMTSGIRRRTVTDKQGAFALPQLVLGGPYALQVMQPGYRPRVTANLFINDNKPVNIDCTLLAKEKR